jgi:hypothetical protein
VSRSLAALAVVSLTFASCAQTATTPWDSRPEARDELLFSLPAWCGTSGPRRPWTAWAESRARPPSARGLCGVRAGPETDDEGLCVEIEDGVIRRASIRRPGPVVALAGLAGRAPGAWIEADAGGVPLHVRIDGAAIAIASSGGIARGPCFWH